MELFDNKKWIMTSNSLMKTKPQSPAFRVKHYNLFYPQVDFLLKDVLDKACHNIGITDSGLLGLALHSGMLAMFSTGVHLKPTTSI